MSAGEGRLLETQFPSEGHIEWQETLEQADKRTL